MAFATVPAAAQVGLDSLEIRSVRFEGGAHFPDEALATAIVTAPTRCLAVAPLCWLGVGLDRRYFDEIQLALDTIRLNLFYYERGFREASIGADTARAGTGIGVTFRIDEGTPVRVGSIRIEGADSVPRDVTRDLPLRVGDPLNEILHDVARDTMIARMRNRGYAHADGLANYSIAADSPYVAHVEYVLIAGARARFGEVEVVGTEKVDSAVVRRMLTFSPGDLFTIDALRNSQRNLFAQEVFRHAEVRPVMDAQPDSIVPVRVQVNEGDLHRVRAGAGASTADYVNLEGRWVSRSFRGGARRLELRARLSNLFATVLPDLPVFEPTDDFYGKLSGLVSADFTQPWFFGALNTLGAGVFAERRSIPDVFVRSGAGGYVTFSRSLGPGTSIGVGYRPELTRLEAKDGDFIFCIGFTACGEEDIAALRDPHWLAPLTVQFAHDRANSIFAPTRGYSIRVDGELASPATASEFTYARLAADLTDYHSFGNGIVSALRIKPGWARALRGVDASLGVHPQKRFFAGGANSVRGFAQYRLGPKLLVADAVRRLLPSADSGGAGCTIEAVNDGSCDARALAARDPVGAFSVQPVGGAVSFEGNVELRFPVYGDNLRGAAFVDFGQVWESHRTFDPADIVWTPGLGVRYFSAIGPVRVDVGYYGGRGETLTVVTTQVGISEGDECVPLERGDAVGDGVLCNSRVLQALDTTVRWSPRQSFFDRLQFHFSIGQAF